MIAVFSDVLSTCAPVVARVIIVCAVLVGAAYGIPWLAGHAGRWLRSWPRLRDLMDTGDGQGGVPAAALELADVADPVCDWCTRPDCGAGPQACICRQLGRYCEGIRWCASWWPGNPVPVTWTEREQGIR